MKFAVNTQLSANNNTFQNSVANSVRTNDFTKLVIGIDDFYSIMDTRTSVVLNDKDGAIVFGGNIENAPESYELYEVVDYQLLNGFYAFSLKKDNAVKPVRVIDVIDYIDTSWRIHLVSEDFNTCYYNGFMGDAPTTYDLWYVSRCSINVWKDGETPEYTITIRRTKKEQK